MTLADSAGWAVAVTAVCAVVACFTRVLATSGVVAAFVVGACVSVGFGVPGLTVLGTFFVVGTAATRVGWEKKKARGTAEAGEGRRDWKRVVGKGGVAAACAIAFALQCDMEGRRIGEIGAYAYFAFPGALAAALADTLGTEIGSLSEAPSRSLPAFRQVSIGSPGAVSFMGTIAAIVGAGLVGAAWNVWFGGRLHGVAAFAVVACAGTLGSLAESVAVGLGLRAPGFVRNLLTTLAGAGVTAAALSQ